MVTYLREASSHKICTVIESYIHQRSKKAQGLITACAQSVLDRRRSPKGDSVAPVRVSLDVFGSSAGKVVSVVALHSPLEKTPSGFEKRKEAVSSEAMIYRSLETEIEQTKGAKELLSQVIFDRSLDVQVSINESCQKEMQETKKIKKSSSLDLQFILLVSHDALQRHVTSLKNSSECSLVFLTEMFSAYQREVIRPMAEVFEKKTLSECTTVGGQPSHCTIKISTKQGSFRIEADFARRVSRVISETGLILPEGKDTDA